MNNIQIISRRSHGEVNRRARATSGIWMTSIESPNDWDRWARSTRQFAIASLLYFAIQHRSVKSRPRCECTAGGRQRPTYQN
jgi:hypothetical protein